MVTKGMFAGKNNPFYGKRHSPETKALMTQKKKEFFEKFKGTPQYFAWKENLSKKLKGREISQESRRKISNTLKGHEISISTRNKISQAVKSNPNLYWLGKHRSEETIEKLRLINLGKKCSVESIKKRNETRRKNGWVLSEQTKEKIISARLQQRIPNKFTSIELKLQNSLKQRSIKFEIYKSISNITQPDIFIEPNICIYADGSYWHSLPKRIERDKKINGTLIENGFKILRFSESEINHNLVNCIQKIEEVIKNG